MSEFPTLIYCAAGNPRFAAIARAAGYRYGACLPHTIYPDAAGLFMADQDWVRYQRADVTRRRVLRARYMAALAEYRPVLASVLDWERADQWPEILDWAQEAAQWVCELIIIPKVPGGIGQIPRMIAGRPVRLGYSVPTTHGGTPLHPQAFVGWPLHLLGGSPQWQMRLWRYFRTLDQDLGTETPIRSTDGNYAQKLAMHGQFYALDWQPGPKQPAWPTLVEADGQRWGADVPYEAFRRSCVNIQAAWARLLSDAAVAA